MDPFRGAGDLIRLARERYGDRQKRLGLIQRLVRSFSPPAWLRASPTDKLHRIYEDQWLLRKYGDVVWGHIIQANKMLFEPGDQNCPADVVYSPDKSYDDHLDELARIARSLFDMKGQTTDDPELQRFADVLHDEHEDHAYPGPAERRRHGHRLPHDHHGAPRAPPRARARFAVFPAPGESKCDRGNVHPPGA